MPRRALLAAAVTAMIGATAWTSAHLDRGGTDQGGNGITLTAATVTAGITDSVNGPIISIGSPPGLAADRPVSGSVTITNSSGAAETVSVWQQGLTSPGPDLAGYARLTLFDEVLGQTLYQDTVANFWTAPHTLCGAGAGACPQWAAGEAHTFDFTVLIPDGASVNAYQEASFSTSYQWSGT